MTTKADLINNAYSQGRISGITRLPTPEEISVALNRLENMAAEWTEQNICTGYAFETSPKTTTKHNVPRKYWTAFESNLMVRLLPDFGKDPSIALLSLANSSFSRLSASTASTRQVPYPSRMPRGSGIRYNNYYWRYYYSTERAPNECATVKMNVGDVDNFYEDYTAYLDLGETIASYVMTSDDALTTSDDAISSKRINYTVTATGASSTEVSAVYQVKIVMTTSTARILTRVRNFELTDVDIT